MGSLSFVLIFFFSLYLSEDEQLCRDVMSVAGLLRLVHDCMSPEMLYLFKQDISHNQMPEQSAQQIVSAIMAHARFVRFWLDLLVFYL